MDQHHSFFREKVPVHPKSALRQRNIKALVLFVVSAAYGFFTLFIIQIKNTTSAGISILALYIYGIIGGFGFLLLKQIYTDADRSRKILTEVLEKSAEARAITDPQGETIYSNLRFGHLVGGGSNPSLISFTRIFENPKKVERELEDLRHRAEASGTAIMEMHSDTKDRELWLQITCRHIAGWPGFVHWRFDDISSRHRMEDTIREEREKLRDFTDNAPVGFFSVGEDGKFIFANNTFLQMLGVESRKVIGTMTLHEFLAVPPVNGKPYDCFEGGGAHQNGEVILKSASGNILKATITHSITQDPTGHTISRSVVHDMTKEYKMQQALQESEDRYERLFEEAPVGICMVDPNGTVSATNQTLAFMLRQPVQDINGKTLMSYIRKDFHRRVETWLKSITRREKTEPFIEIPLKSGDHESVAQLYARKFSTSDSVVLHFIDLTEQKNLEKQFTQSQKMQAIGQLAGGIAHDFNNLLTAMIGFCDLLLLRHKPGDPSFSDIMQIKQNANRAANLVRQLLAFSRQQTLQPRVLDLTDVLTELSHLLRRLIGANIDLRMTHGTELALIKADQGQMEQVFINLVVNARDAMPQGGTLTIRTENFSTPTPYKLSGEDILPPGNWVSITIKDSGTGIPADVLPHIFEPFFSTKDVGAGTGLGLATVHGIVHQTGGRIAVNTAVGKGTTFTIYLPQHKEAATGKLALPIDEKPVVHDLTGSSKILLVEDEDAVRVFSARALTNKGYEVADAPSAAVALKLLEDKKIDPELLITDVMMPEMDGTTLAKIVREKYPHVKIIFISGYAEDRFKEHLGAHVYFLPKPFTLKQLATKVKEVIEDNG